MYVLLIYVKSFKNNFKRVHFAVKFEAVGRDSEAMFGC